MIFQSIAATKDINESIDDLIDKTSKLQAKSMLTTFK